MIPEKNNLLAIGHGIMCDETAYQKYGITHSLFKLVMRWGMMWLQ